MIAMDVTGYLRDRLGNSFANRFGADEIEAHTRDGLRDYARITGAFIRQAELAVNRDGLLQLPDDALRAVEIRTAAGDKLEFSSYRNLVPRYGAAWFRETAREAIFAVTDFDEFNLVRLVPQPPEGTLFHVVILTADGETDERITAAVAEYVAALLMLRESDNSAMPHYNNFLKLAGPVGNSTRLPGSQRGGTWF